MLQQPIGLPALVVFGCQTAKHTTEDRRQLRALLYLTPRLSPIVAALSDLARLLESVEETHPGLVTARARAGLSSIEAWAANEDIAESEGLSSSTFGTFITLIEHLVLYSRYLDVSGILDAHEKILRSVKSGGIHGFCTGLLAAVSISCSRSDADIGKLGAWAVRLALLIGVAVDSDESDPECPKFKSFVVRWKSPSIPDKLHALLEPHVDSYVAVIEDVTRATITAPASSSAELMKQLAELDLTVKEIDLSGRFHTGSHRENLLKLQEFISSRPELSLPSIAVPSAPVRSNSDAQIIKDGRLISTLLRNILIEPCNWYMTISTALASLSRICRPTILTVGNCTSIPTVLNRSMQLNVQSVTVSALNSTSLTRQIDPQSNLDTPSKNAANMLAVVGMGMKFPSASSAEEFWELLLHGQSVVSKMPLDRFDAESLSRASKEGAQFWGAFLDDIKSFDHKFFKKSSREAASMDPQQRLLLEVAYQALESAGYFSSAGQANIRDIGCYLGTCSNDYNDNVASHSPNAFSSLGTLRAFLAGKISHFFNWTGPSMTFDTACSSSAVAINAACKAILAGECSMAIAGGVSLYTSPFFYQNLDAAGFLSPTGPCKPFDADADGYLRGEGAGFVVLKRLDAAIANGDWIRGVIASSSVNQNTNSSAITVPCALSQGDLFRKTLSDAQINPSDIDYVEAHGTGTKVGDPIEYSSIREVFVDSSRSQPLYMASVKGNIGHLEGAAGIASLIKVLLMMQNKTIVPQANFKSLNPNIQRGESEICIPTASEEWASKYRTACVNNYGASGSNAAIIVCEAPERMASAGASRDLSKCKYPIYIAAQTSGSLQAYCKKLHEASSTSVHSHDYIARLSFTLSKQQNRDHRYAVVASVSNSTDLSKCLTATTSDGANIITQASRAPPIVLVFGGQSNEAVFINKGFYDSVALFRLHLDTCDAILQSLGFKSFYPMIFSEDQPDDFITYQLTLFSIQYASARSWIDSGLEVSCVVGHSFGQLTALCVSGALSLFDGLKLVSGRASLMQRCWPQERGSMIATEADVTTLSGLIDLAAPGTRPDKGQFEIACYNGPKSNVVVGSRADVDALEGTLSSQHIKHKKLSTSHAFHSYLTNPLLKDLESLAAELTFHPPAIPIETCSPQEAWSDISARQIAEHTRMPVYFDAAVKRIETHYGPCVWLEAGSSSPITALVRRSLSIDTMDQNSFIHTSLHKTTALDSLVNTTSELWKLGVNATYWPFHIGQQHEYGYIDLPPYQFEKSQHWLEWIDQPKTSPAETPLESQTEPKLVSFHKFLGGTKEKAEFIIDPRCTDYRLLVEGHGVLSQSLCPASMYLELVAQAATHLLPQMLPLSFDDLQIKSPLGVPMNSRIALVLNQITSSSPAWSFELSSCSTGGQPNGKDMPSIVHAIGNVSASNTPGSEPTQQFMSYERLIDLERFTNLETRPNAQIMQGQLIYNVFSRVTNYAEYYKGVRKIVTCDNLAMGVIELPKQNTPAFKPTLTSPLASDNFLQIAGLQVNCMGSCDQSEVYICGHVASLRFRAKGNVLDSAKSLIVCSSASRKSDRSVIHDVFVFDGECKNLLALVLGAEFVKVPINALVRMLSKASGSNVDVKKTSNTEAEVTNLRRSRELASTGQSRFPSPSAESHSSSSVSGSSATDTSLIDQPDHTAELIAVLAESLDITDTIELDTNLAGLGLDSLMSMELASEVHKQLGRTLEPANLDATSSVQDLVNLVYPEQAAQLASKSQSAPEDVPTASIQTPLSRSVPWDSVNTPKAMFSSSKGDFGAFSSQSGFLGFFDTVSISQRSLVVEYILEAFDQLNAPLTSTRPGNHFKVTDYLPKFEPLVQQLYHILQDEGLLIKEGSTYLRSAKSIQRVAATQRLQDIVDAHSKHSNEHKLLAVVGSKLTQILLGTVNPLQLVFSDKDSRLLLEQVYAHGPMYDAINKTMAGYLAKLYSKNGDKTVRILELGAGTGGTTRHVLEHLRRLGISFVYTFTDISSSLVAAAKRKFGTDECMEYMVLDIEKEAPSKLLGSFDTVLSTNCVHATENLSRSCSFIRSLLNDDGFVLLAEFTRNLTWFDIVFGIFEGWWLFNDGRTHVLAEEKFWARSLLSAGFDNVDWTDGPTEEEKTLRVVAGFCGNPSTPSHPSVQPRGIAPPITKTVNFKEVNGLLLQADTYLPGAEQVPGKRPVAILIHGGGHIMLSRKDVRQIQMLIDFGFLPISIDYRLCPEVNIRDGPMTDVASALHWAQSQLSGLDLGGVIPDTEKTVVVGWSTGGTLALQTGWTSIERGLRAPSAILAFYCPTDYEDECWSKPNHPEGSTAASQAEYGSILEGVQSKPIVGYNIPSEKRPIGGWMSTSDPRSRIVLHMNWHGQALPVLLNGLPSESAANGGDDKDWHALPQPDLSQVSAISPYAHVRDGSYKTPTFVIHGTEDDLIPWQQTQRFYEELKSRSIPAGVQIVKEEKHLFDLRPKLSGDAERAVKEGYKFLLSFV